MQQRATAQARYPANTTYLFRIQPTEQYQARKPVFCITKSTSLLSLLSFEPQYHLSGIQYQRTLDWRPIILVRSLFLYRLRFNSCISLFSALSHLRSAFFSLFVQGSVSLPFHPSPHAFPPTFPLLNSLLMYLNPSSPHIKLRNHTYNVHSAHPHHHLEHI